MLVNNSKLDISLAVENEDGRHDSVVRLVPESTFFNADLIRRLLGIKLGRQELKPETARFLGLTSTEGLIIAEVDRDTPAAESLEPGYLVTRIDGQTPAHSMPAAKLLNGTKSYQILRLTLRAHPPPR